MRRGYRVLMRTYTDQPPVEVVWFRVSDDVPLLADATPFRSLLYSDWTGHHDAVSVFVTRKKAIRLVNHGLGEQRPADLACCRWAGQYYNSKPPAPYTGHGACIHPRTWEHGGVWGVDPPLTINADGSATCCVLAGQITAEGGISWTGEAEWGPTAFWIAEGGISWEGEAMLQVIHVCYVDTFDTFTVLDIGECDKVVFRVEGAVTVLGFTGGVQGRLLVVRNLGSDTVTLKDNGDGGSANTVFWPLATDYVLWPNETVVLEWDEGNAAWYPDHPTVGLGEVDPTPSIYPLRYLQIGPGISLNPLGAGFAEISAGGVTRGAAVSSNISAVDIDTVDTVTDSLTITTYGGPLLVSYTFSSYLSSVNIQTDIYASITVDGVTTNAQTRYNLTSWPGGTNTQQPVAVSLTGLVLALAAGVHAVEAVLVAAAHTGGRVTTRCLVACEQGPV